MCPSPAKSAARLEQPDILVSKNRRKLWPDQVERVSELHWLGKWRSSARNAIAYSASENGLAAGEAARAALRLLGIADLADREYTRISGGQRQLALIARAIAQDTPAIVMDEPTASLDFRRFARGPIQFRARLRARNGAQWVGAVANAMGLANAVRYAIV